MTEYFIVFFKQEEEATCQKKMSQFTTFWVMIASEREYGPYLMKAIFMETIAKNYENRHLT